MTRRGLLRTAIACGVALGGAGCSSPAWLGRLRQGTSRTAPLVVPTKGPGGVYSTVPSLARTFNRDHAAVQVATPTISPHGTESVYRLAVSDPGLGAAGTLAPLDSALNAQNFNASALEAGALDGFHRGPHGELVSLPTAQFPIAIRWRRDVFDQANLQPPAADWTLSDFTDACAAIADLVQRRTVAGLQSVLAPLLGYTPKGTRGFWGGLFSPGWWVAFVLGHGGSTLDASGAFAIDPPGLEGLAALVDIVRRFGPSASALPATAADLPTMMSRYAMVLDYWQAPGGPQLAQQMPTRLAVAPPLSFGPEWAWARAPVFPARPLITTILTGEGLAIATGRQQDGQDAQLLAASEALTWLYSADAQTALQGFGYVPVLGGAAAQGTFWQRYGADARAPGDWRQFTPYNAGWPWTPDSSAMFGALSGAAMDPSQLASLVATATSRMNANMQVNCTTC